MTHELTSGDYTVSDDPTRIDIGYVHAFLTKSYWSPGIPRDVVERGVANSLPLGVYDASGA